nr:hypothetical protein [Tanacetum cinerariifolium]
MDLLQNLLDICTTLTRRVKNLEHEKIAQDLEITKLKQRVKKLERRNKASKLQRLKKVDTTQWIETYDDTIMDDISKQGRVIADMDADKDVTLKDVAAVAKDVQDVEIEEKPAELQEVVEVVTTAKLITEVVTAASATITTAALQLTTAVALTLTTAPSAARRRKGVVIRDLEETTTPSTIIHTEAKSKDKGKRILKEDNVVKRCQALKRKPQTKAQARKNMMIYLKNVAGFKMDYFKGMTYDDILLIFEKYFNSNVAFLQKTKEQMEEEDNRALKRLSENYYIHYNIVDFAGGEEISTYKTQTPRGDFLEDVKFPRWVEAKVVSSEVEGEEMKKTSPINGGGDGGGYGDEGGDGLAGVTGWCGAAVEGGGARYSDSGGSGADFRRRWVARIRPESGRKKGEAPENI